MHETRVLLVFPGRCTAAAGPTGRGSSRELVQLFTELRRTGFETDVLDLEAELGNPLDEVGRESFLQIGGALLAEHEADLVVVSCRSACHTRPPSRSPSACASACRTP